MDIYLEYKDFTGTIKNINDIVKKLNEQEQFNLHIVYERKVSLIELILLIRKLKRFSSFEIITEPKNITKSLIRFANGNSKLGILFLTKSKLTMNELKKVSSIKGIIRVIDFSNQNKQLCRNRNIIMCNGDKDDLKTADIYNLLSRTNPIYQCRFSSCLGNTLYISKNKAVSFCPKYTEQSKLGNLDELLDFFSNNTFYEVLEQTITKRKQCKNECVYFEKCKGGCPFEDDCSEFKNTYQTAKNEIDEIIAEKTDISQIPFYKEYALLNYLCSKIRD